MALELFTAKSTKNTEKISKKVVLRALRVFVVKNSPFAQW